MAVISQGKGQNKPKRAGTMKRKKSVKRRNASAAALADPLYRSRVVKSAKTYNRKQTPKPGEDEDT